VWERNKKKSAGEEKEQPMTLAMVDQRFELMRSGKMRKFDLNNKWKGQITAGKVSLSSEAFNLQFVRTVQSSLI
jgi:hypothetical protein